MFSSDPLMPSLGARSQLNAIAFLDYGSIALSRNKSTIYSISAGLGFVSTDKAIGNFISRKFGHRRKLNIYIDNTLKEMGYFTIERFKLTKRSRNRFEKRNSRKLFTGVYNGISLGITYIDLWDERAYFNGGTYLKSFHISPVIPVNIELGISRYYQLRTNWKHFNFGTDFKMFALFQLPNITRLDVTKLNSDFSETERSYHLTIPMVRVGLQLSIPNFTITLRSAEKTKE